jgi:hypothetical protein
MKRIYHALDGLDHSGIQDRLRDAKSDIEDLIAYSTTCGHLFHAHVASHSMTCGHTREVICEAVSS